MNVARVRLAAITALYDLRNLNEIGENNICRKKCLDQNFCQNPKMKIMIRRMTGGWNE